MAPEGTVAMCCCVRSQKSEMLPRDAFDFLQSEEAIAAYLDAVMDADGFCSVEERVAFITDANHSHSIVPGGLLVTS
jgi:DNA-binding phage protein